MRGTDADEDRPSIVIRDPDNAWPAHVIPLREHDTIGLGNDYLGPGCGKGDMKEKGKRGEIGVFIGKA